MFTRTCLMLILGLCLTIGASGCSDSSDSTSKNDKPIVVCTTTMIADLARQIGGDKINVQDIMKPGEDPHVYDVRPRDAQMIERADLVLMNGLHLEATLASIVENHQKADRIVRLAESSGITPLTGEATAGAPDPHCWFNVRYFKIYAESARDALMKLDPDHAEHYRQRTEAYIQQLDELDAWVREQIAGVPRGQRVMVTSHDAFNYFGHAYDIDVLAIIGISTEQQPRPQDITQLEQLVQQRNVKALFVETSVSATLNDIIRKIADRTGARIGGSLFSDSLGDVGSGAETYIDMVRHNTNTIVAALK